MGEQARCREWNREEEEEEGEEEEEKHCDKLGLTPLLPSMQEIDAFLIADAS